MTKQPNKLQYEPISVEYLDHMGDDLAVVNAARVSFDKWKEEFDLSADTKLIKYLADNGHWSPFAHATIKIRATAPIFVARQLVKHQVGFSWNEVSRRYVTFLPTFWHPENFRAKAENAKQGSSDESVINEKIALKLYEDTIQQSLQAYTDLLDLNVCPEQARAVLPLSHNTTWIWTGSLYAWARMANERLDLHAQKECRMFAELLSPIVREQFPVSWGYLTEK